MVGKWYNCSMEIYKKINNCDYAVSNLGNIKRLSTNRVLKQTITDRGYSRVDIYINKKRKSCKVHRYVAMYFLGDLSEAFEVNHIDGNKQNNSVENLEWITHRENIIHAYDKGLMKRKSGGNEI